MWSQRGEGEEEKAKKERESGKKDVKKTDRGKMGGRVGQRQNETELEG